MNTSARQPVRPFALRRCAGASRPGFTLIELIVVVSIIALLVGMAFPFMRGMLRSSQEQMAANSISNAVQAARAYATRYKPFTNSFQGRTSEDDGDGYSGAALIITPANELRVSENDELAEYRGRRLEVPGFGSLIYNGYKPIADLDDLLLPRGVAVLGMVRTGANEITLLPPPFAVSFSRRGELMTQFQDPNNTAATNLGAIQRADGFVYYDGNGDGIYEVIDNGDSVYSSRDEFVDADRTLENFRRGVAEKILIDSPTDLKRETTEEEETALANGEDPFIMSGRLVLPFEKIEPVIGVVIVQPDRVPARFFISSDDPSEINASGTGPGGNDNFHPQRAAPMVINTNEADNFLEWASKPAGGQVLFFNRRTGAELRR